MLTALLAYESTSSEEERVQPPVNDNSTPKCHKPLAPTDLLRRLDGEAASKIPNQRKHPTQLSKVDLRRKLNMAQRILHRDPVPQKMAPNCSEEHRQDRHHHHLIGTGGKTQKKMKKKNVARTISPRINMREMILHNKRIRENYLQEKDTLTPQILSPKRVRDSRHLNGDKAADADTKTPYVTIQTSPSTCQKSRHPRKYKQIKMLCQ